MIRSLLGLVFHPGRLTTAWIEGHRNQNTTPIQLYLLMASAFFLLNAYVPFIVFDPADHSIVSSLTAAQVGTQLTEAQLAQLGTDGVSLSVFKERFDARVSMLLGPLLISTVVLFSILMTAIARGGRPFLHHAVFALHWCSFFLLLESIHRVVGGGRTGELVTALTGMVYLVVAMARVYGGWLRAVIVGPLLMLLFIFLVGLWMSATLWIALP